MANFYEKKRQAQQETMDLMRKGIAEQAEELAKQQEKNRHAENVQNIKTSGSDNPENMTTDEKLELLTKAVADLTIKVNGGASDGE